MTHSGFITNQSHRFQFTGLEKHQVTYAFLFDLLHGAGGQRQRRQRPLARDAVLVNGHEEFPVDVETREEELRAVTAGALSAGASPAPGQSQRAAATVRIAVIAKLVVGEIHLRVFVRWPEVEDADLTLPSGP